MNLGTRYLGLNLKNPLIHSASPLTRKPSNLHRLEDAGVAAIVMHSLFEEQIEEEGRMLDQILSQGADSFGEASSYLPDYQIAPVGAEEHLEHLSRSTSEVHIPIIASLNGSTLGGWVDYAARIEATGVAGLELNLYHVAADPDIDGREIEARYVEVVRAVCANTCLPVAVKLSPFLTAPANFARQLVAAGAKALVLFNRFYQPDINLETLEVVPNLKLSHSDELRLPLRWTALLSGRIPADFAITGGIHHGDDLIKSILCGAKTGMITSAVLAHGYSCIPSILERLRQWMEENEYEQVEEMTGAMCRDHVGDPSVYERANYMKVLGSYAY
ncbi:MAG: dihydroorotate dehydrogenase-like protein [Verrucomicrobiales bacterium]